MPKTEEKEESRGARDKEGNEETSSKARQRSNIPFLAGSPRLTERVVLASTAESGRSSPGHEHDTNGGDEAEQQRWAVAWIPERVSESALFAVCVWIRIRFRLCITDTAVRRRAIGQRHIVGGENSHEGWSWSDLEVREGGSRGDEWEDNNATGDRYGGEEVHAVGGYRYWTDIVPHRVSAAISDLACRFYLRSDGSGGSGGDEWGMARGETTCRGEVHSGWMGFPDSCSTTTLSTVSV